MIYGPIQDTCKAKRGFCLYSCRGHRAGVTQGVQVTSLIADSTGARGKDPSSAGTEGALCLVFLVLGRRSLALG